EQYIWDFDGDGKVNRITDSPVTTFKFHAQGTFTPALTVKDNEDSLGNATGEPIIITSGWQGAFIDQLSFFPGATALTFVKDKDKTTLYLAYAHEITEELRMATALL